MNPLATFIATINVVAAAVAAYLHLRCLAVDVHGSRSWKAHLSTGVLSAVYSIGYAVLALGLVPVVGWSELFRGLSILVWPLVWWWPAISGYRTMSANRVAAAQFVEQAEQLRLARSGDGG